MTHSRPTMLILLLAVTALATITAWADGRVARVKQDIFLYGNWDAPGMALDTCLDMSITEVKIPDSINVNGRTYPVWEIGPRAFKGCMNLNKVVLNNSLGVILREAFHNCPNLRVLVNPNPVPFKMEDNHPFYGGKFSDIFESYHAQSVVLVVPPGSEEAYRNALGWKEFQTIQSTMPTDEQLNNGAIESRIAQLENELQQARQYVHRLEAELDALKRANPPR